MMTSKGFFRTKHFCFKPNLLSSLCPMILTSFPARSSISLVIETFQNRADKYHKLQYCPCLYLCLPVFPTHGSKWVKWIPQCLSGAAWLLLLWSDASLREEASFFFFNPLGLPGLQSCVSQFWRVHFVCWVTGSIKTASCQWEEVYVCLMCQKWVQVV